MRLLPLPLSAHPSAWAASAEPAEGQDPASSAPCQFCGFNAGSWQERFHCDGDHANDSADNLVPTCPLCHLSQHPERPQIDAEATLIWMPEMSQAMLNCFVRNIHLTLHGNNEPADMRRTPRSGSPGVLEAFRAYRALRDRAAPAFDRLGSNSFADLGAALLDLSPNVYARRAELLAGLRLLPLGQFFHDGQDVYSRMLTAWNPTSTSRS